MNIRRLPAWALSGAHHKAVHGLAPDYTPLPLESADEIVARTDADDLLRWMTDPGRLRVGLWLRAEMLEQDVPALLAMLGIPPARAQPAVAGVGWSTSATTTAISSSNSPQGRSDRCTNAPHVGRDRT
jgi:hypothetical protein